MSTNQSFKLADLEKLVPEAFQSVTLEMWKSYCKHAEKEEDNFWQKDGMQEDIVESYIITNEIDDNEEDYEVTEVDSYVPH